MDDADAQAVTGRIPHYAIPNQAALLPEYINSEAEVIHQAFVPANCMVAGSIPSPHNFFSFFSFFFFSF
jgi:hypothetical protein